jgi:micrococcal nuclease
MKIKLNKLYKNVKTIPQLTVFVLVVGITIFMANKGFIEITSSNNTIEITNSSNEQSFECYKVTRVVDGDTIDIDYNGEVKRIRFIGVDTPETVKPNTKVEEYGKEASDFTKEKLTDKIVTLEFDIEKEDKYSRTLAYVYLDGVMFNKVLLEEGYAQVATFPPNVKYVDEFIEIERKAREANKGLWGLSD